MGQQEEVANTEHGLSEDVTDLVDSRPLFANLAVHLVRSVSRIIILNPGKRTGEGKGWQKEMKGLEATRGIRERFGATQSP